MKWFSLGYGAVEFHRDLHAAIFAVAAWGAIRIPQITTFTQEQFVIDLKMAASILAAKFLASYVLNNKPPDSK